MGNVKMETSKSSCAFPGNIFSSVHWLSRHQSVGRYLPSQRNHDLTLTLPLPASRVRHMSCCRSLGRQADVFQLLLNTSNHFFVELLLRLLRRIARALVASFVPAPGAYFLVVLERCLTCVAGPSDVHPDLFAVSGDQGIHFFSVARVAIRILVELGPATSSQCGQMGSGGTSDLRVARALGTAQMLASRTFRSLPREERAAHMACPAYSLHWRPSLQIFPRHTRSHCQGNHFGIIIDGDIQSLPLAILGRFHRVPRAFLTARMIAIATSLVRAECRLAAMAAPMDPHPNLFLNSLGAGIDRRCPFARSQCQPIFRKQCARFFFLNRTTGRSCPCQSRISGFGARFDISDRLL